MKKHWMLAAGVVLVAGASAPWIVGKLTEQHWQQAVAEMNDAQPFFSLQTDDYQRGYLSSRFSGRLTFDNPETGGAESLAYQAAVSHGLTGSRIHFVADNTESESWPQLFPDRQPELVLTTRVWGNARADLSVPAISVDDGKSGESLNISESYGWVTVSDGGDAVDFRMHWPGAVLRGADYRVSLENLQMEQDMKRLQGEVWTGKAEIVLDGFSLARSHEPELRLDALRFDSETVATDGGDRFTSHSLVSLEKTRLGMDEFGPHQVELAISGISVDAWNQMMGAFREFQEASASAPYSFERQLAAATELGEAMKVLAGSGFTVGIPQLSVMSPEGAITGELTVSHPELNTAGQSEMALVMEKLTGQMNLSIPAALTERYPAMAEQFVPLLLQGLLVQQDDLFRMEATLKDLQLILNGQVIPLPPLI